jgi:hypothetical protein
MSDLPEQLADDRRARAEVDSDEIARSLGSVWQRFSGQRPKSTSVEIRQDVVRCVIQEATPEPESDLDHDASDAPSLSPAGLKHNATAAITRITGRRVVAFIPKRDKKMETCTQTFLLDQPRQRF